MGAGYDMRLEIVGSCLRMAGLLLSKNAGYGNSAADPLMVFSRLGARERLGVRMDDKLSRLARGRVDGQEDTRGDLCGYLHLDGIVGRMGEGAAPVSREEVMGLWGEVWGSVAGGTCKVAREEGEELEAERGRSWELAETLVWWQEQEEKLRRELGEQLAAEREISERLSGDLVRKEGERRELWERAHAAEREAAGLPGLREELAEARQEHKDAVELAEKCLRQTEYWRKSREASEEQRRVVEQRLEVMEEIVQSKLEVIEGLRARLGYVEGGGFRGLMARVFGRKAGKGEEV